MHPRRAATLALALTLLAFPLSALADSFSSVVVYGDSLSDNGNLYAAVQGVTGVGYPPPPYYNGRFSNGPVTVEQLAASLGSPLLDFAYGGATTGLGNLVDGGTQTSSGAFGLPGMLAEFAAGKVPSTLIPSSLFVVWGGADDFETKGSPTTAVENIDTIVATLQAEGATHILVPGLPNLALTPEFYGSAAASAYTTAFNAGLESSLPAGATYFNVASLVDSITADPSAYGLTDVTTPCFNGLTVCSDPGQHLFWDDIHPTTAADAILAKQFETAVTTTTPEPSSILLLGTGIVGLAGLVKRRITR